MAAIPATIFAGDEPNRAGFLKAQSTHVEIGRENRCRALWKGVGEILELFSIVRNVQDFFAASGYGPFKPEML